MGSEEFYNIETTSVFSLQLSTTVTLSKEHPAVAQADQMNAFIDTYFVEHEASTSSQNMDNADREQDECVLNHPIYSYRQILKT